MAGGGRHKSLNYRDLNGKFRVKRTFNVPKLTGEKVLEAVIPRTGLKR